MDNQRLRNLTTGRLHTNISDIYQDLEWIMGEGGIMTHMLPNVLTAVTPWLQKYVTDQRFWDGKFDVTHTGNFHLPEPTKEDRNNMFKRYTDLPSPF